MNERVQKCLLECPYTLHTVVERYDTYEKLVSVQADKVFSSASIIKVPLLLAILAQVEQNERDLYEVLTISEDNKVDFSVLTEQNANKVTLYDALLWMTISSDNTATNVCIDYLGMHAINAYFQEIGLKQTKLQRKMLDFERQLQGFDNETTATDMQKLFRALYKGTLLSPQMNAIALDILARQRSTESLKRYIPDKIKVAHKTGGLDTVDHDVGIFFTSTIDYFIGVFVTNVENNEQAKQYIGKLSKLIYDALKESK